MNGKMRQISCLGVGGGLETNEEGRVLDLMERTEEAQGLVGIRAGELWSREGWGEGWAAFLPLKVKEGDAEAVGEGSFPFSLLFCLSSPTPCVLPCSCA